MERSGSMLNESSPSSGNGKSKMSQARSKVQEKAKSMFSDGKSQVSDSLGNIAQAFRSTSEQMRSQNLASVAGYADQAAESIERMASHIRDRNVDELLNEAENLARKQPVAAVAGAFAIGFILARIAKGSRSM